MSDHSEFIILVGTGHHYGGEGLLLESTLTMNTDNGGWMFVADNKPMYWRIDSMENALLIVSLYLVTPYVQSDGPFYNLRKKAESLFKVDLFKHGIDTSDKKHITNTNLQELYEDNKKALSGSNVKLVGLRLGAQSIQSSITIDFFKEAFIETGKEYGLKNLEYCETVYGRYYGGFSGEPLECVGKIVPQETKKEND